MRDIAAGNLAIGSSVLIDAVNSVTEARDIWVELAATEKVPLRTVEVVLADTDEHRRRVEQRDWRPGRRPRADLAAGDRARVRAVGRGKTRPPPGRRLR